MDRILLLAAALLLPMAANAELAAIANPQPAGNAHWECHCTCGSPMGGTDFPMQFEGKCDGSENSSSCGASGGGILHGCSSVAVLDSHTESFFEAELFDSFSR